MWFVCSFILLIASLQGLDAALRICPLNYIPYTNGAVFDVNQKHDHMYILKYLHVVCKLFAKCLLYETKGWRLKTAI